MFNTIYNVVKHHGLFEDDYEAYEAMAVVATRRVEESVVGKQVNPDLLAQVVQAAMHDNGVRRQMTGNPTLAGNILGEEVVKNLGSLRRELNSVEDLSLPYGTRLPIDLVPQLEAKVARSICGYLHECTHGEYFDAEKIPGLVGAYDLDGSDGSHWVMECAVSGIRPYHGYMVMLTNPRGQVFEVGTGSFELSDAPRFNEMKLMEAVEKSSPTDQAIYEMAEGPYPFDEAGELDTSGIPQADLDRYEKAVDRMLSNIEHQRNKPLSKEEREQRKLKMLAHMVNMKKKHMKPATPMAHPMAQKKEDVGFYYDDDYSLEEDPTDFLCPRCGGDFYFTEHTKVLKEADHHYALCPHCREVVEVAEEYLPALLAAGGGDISEKSLLKSVGGGALKGAAIGAGIGLAGSAATGAGMGSAITGDLGAAPWGALGGLKRWGAPGAAVGSLVGLGVGAYRGYRKYKKEDTPDEEDAAGGGDIDEGVFGRMKQGYKRRYAQGLKQSSGEFMRAARKGGPHQKMFHQAGFQLGKKAKQVASQTSGYDDFEEAADDVAFRCPNCNQKLGLTPEEIEDASEIKCPKCGTVFGPEVAGGSSGEGEAANEDYFGEGCKAGGKKTRRRVSEDDWYGEDDDAGEAYDEDDSYGEDDADDEEAHAEEVMREQFQHHKPKLHTGFRKPGGVRHSNASVYFSDKDDFEGVMREHIHEMALVEKAKRKMTRPPSKGLSSKYKSKQVKKMVKGQTVGMRPETFKAVEKKAAEAGYADPQAVAGAAEWRTIKARKKGPVKEALNEVWNPQERDRATDVSNLPHNLDMLNAALAKVAKQYKVDMTDVEIPGQGVLDSTDFSGPQPVVTFVVKGKHIRVKMPKNYMKEFRQKQESINEDFRSDFYKAMRQQDSGFRGADEGPLMGGRVSAAVSRDALLAVQAARQSEAGDECPNPGRKLRARKGRGMGVGGGTGPVGDPGVKDEPRELGRRGAGGQGRFEQDDDSASAKGTDAAYLRSRRRRNYDSGPGYDREENVVIPPGEGINPMGAFAEMGDEAKDNAAAKMVHQIAKKKERKGKRLSPERAAELHQKFSRHAGKMGEGTGSVGRFEPFNRYDMMDRGENVPTDPNDILGMMDQE